MFYDFRDQPFSRKPNFAPVLPGGNSEFVPFDMLRDVSGGHDEILAIHFKQCSRANRLGFLPVLENEGNSSTSRQSIDSVDGLSDQIASAIHCFDARSGRVVLQGLNDQPRERAP